MSSRSRNACLTVDMGPIASDVMLGRSVADGGANPTGNMEGTTG